MFGIYRTYLAFAVMAYHLLDVPVIGEYAVFSFFVLSGFLMTMIMQDTYGYSSNGIKRYAMNRALRLYPTYWVSLLIAIGVIAIAGSAYVAGYKDAIAIPVTLGDWATNISMIFPGFIPYYVTPRLSPPTWALTIEIIFYALIGLGLSRTKLLSLAWLVASMAYVAVTLAMRTSFEYRYGAIPAGSLPFAVGACAYHFKDEIFSAMQRYRVGSSGLLVVAHILVLLIFSVCDAMTGKPLLKNAGIYMNTVLSMLIVVQLHRSGHVWASRRVDKFIGDFSYPVYLLHWPIGALASFILFDQPTRGTSIASLESFALATALTALFSAAIVLIMDPSIERIRDAVRSRRSSTRTDLTTFRG